MPMMKLDLTALIYTLLKFSIIYIITSLFDLDRHFKDEANDVQIEL